MQIFSIKPTYFSFQFRSESIRKIVSMRKLHEVMLFIDSDWLSFEFHLCLKFLLFIDTGEFRNTEQDNLQFLSNVRSLIFLPQVIRSWAAGFHKGVDRPDSFLEKFGMGNSSVYEANEAPSEEKMCCRWLFIRPHVDQILVLFLSLFRDQSIAHLD